MSNDNKNILDDNEVMAMTVGFMVGIGILALPRGLVADAKQDAWISAILGSIYPLYVVGATLYISKYYPEENVLVVTKKYLGNMLGTILNVLFMLFFYIYIVISTTGFINIFRTYGTPFLKPLKMQIVLLILVIYASSKGLKVMGKMNEFVFYAMCLLMISMSIALLKGKIINIKPILGSGITNILKASKESAYAYGGIEQILLIYPFMKNKKKLKPTVLKAVGITIVFYTWTTFISIYFLGYKLTRTNLWPVFLVSDSFSLPLINSFKSIFLLGWAGVMCNLLNNEYTAILDILSYTLNVKNRKWLHIGIIPLILYGFTKIPNQVYRVKISDKIIPIATMYSLVYIWIIVVLIFFDKNKTKKI